MIESKKIKMSKSEEETEALGSQFAQRLQGGEVIGLVGDLGAGKTAFVRGMAKGLQLDTTQVVSPTFTLVNEYPGTPLTLIHVDLYRLNHPAELATLGLEDYFSARQVMVIEWADKLPSLWFKDMILITVQIHNGTRKIQGI